MEEVIRYVLSFIFYIFYCFPSVIGLRTNIITPSKFLPLFYFNTYKFKKKVLRSFPISLFSEILSIQFLASWCTFPRRAVLLCLLGKRWAHLVQRQVSPRPCLLWVHNLVVSMKLIAVIIVNLWFSTLNLTYISL